MHYIFSGIITITSNGRWRCQALVTWLDYTHVDGYVISGMDADTQKPSYHRPCVQILQCDLAKERTRCDATIKCAFASNAGVPAFSVDLKRA